MENCQVCSKFKLDPRILSSSFKKRHLWQKAQEPIKNIISQYLYYVPSHPKDQRRLRSHVGHCVCHPAGFQLTLSCVYPFLKSSLLGFCKKLQLHTRLWVSAWPVMACIPRGKGGSHCLWAEGRAPKSKKSFR